MGFDKVVLSVRIVSFSIYFTLSYLLSAFIFPLFEIDAFIGIALIFMMVIGLSVITSKPIDNFLKGVLSNRVQKAGSELDINYLKGVDKHTLKRFKTVSEPITKNRMLYLAFIFHYEVSFEKFEYLNEITQLVNETKHFEENVLRYYDIMMTEALLNQDVELAKEYNKKWLDYIEMIVDSGELEGEKEQFLLNHSTIVRDFERLFYIPNMNNAGKIVKKLSATNSSIQARYYDVAIILLDNGIKEGTEYLDKVIELGGNTKPMKAVNYILENKLYD